MNPSPFDVSVNDVRLGPRERVVTCPTCGSPALRPMSPHCPFGALTCRLVDLGVGPDSGYGVPTNEHGDVP